MFISQDDLRITAKYDRFLHINSTSVEKKGGHRMFSVLVFVLNDRDGILHHMESYKAPTVARLLREGSVKVSHVRISKFLAKFEETGSIGRRIESGRPSKRTAQMKKLVEDQMHSDVETTVYQLHKFLTSKDNSISVCTVLFVN